MILIYRDAKIAYMALWGIEPIGVRVNEKAAKTYADLMKEVKERVAILHACMEGDYGMPAVLAEEVCYLQLRMICESIALGCLVAHGDLKPSRSVLKAYKPTIILRALDRLHPDFFPIPLENSQPAGAGAIETWVRRESHYLTQQEVRKLWDYAGRKLHRGSFKGLSSDAKTPDFDRIVEWLRKIINLLNRHHLPSPDKSTLLYLQMTIHGSDEVHYAIFQQRG